MQKTTAGIASTRIKPVTDDRGDSIMPAMSHPATFVYDPLEYKKWSAPTDLGIVVDAIRNVMRKLWEEESPAKPLDTHAMPYEDEFKAFCEQKLYCIIKGGIK